MGLFDIKSKLAGFGLVSVVVSIMHFFEDAALVILRRYITINIWVAILAGVLFSICVAAIFKLQFVKRMT
ncbi:MAG: hypothetical protein CL788_03455 [Chloroflexi bacterium]|nr:hypothetical protein [Chloroflexota bacterium]|tara:strand:- start:1109 stop:1318 length:210 start_codon:yes stop_codon:yes gene_type:complete